MNNIEITANMTDFAYIRHTHARKHSADKFGRNGVVTGRNAIAWRHALLPSNRICAGQYLRLEHTLVAFRRICFMRTISVGILHDKMYEIRLKHWQCCVCANAAAFAHGCTIRSSIFCTQWLRTREGSVYGTSDILSVIPIDATCFRIYHMGAVTLWEWAGWVVGRVGWWWLRCCWLCMNTDVLCTFPTWE